MLTMSISADQMASGQGKILSQGQQQSITEAEETQTSYVLLPQNFINLVYLLIYLCVVNLELFIVDMVTSAINICGL